MSSALSARSGNGQVTITFDPTTDPARPRSSRRPLDGPGSPRQRIPGELVDALAVNFVPSRVP